MLTGVEVKSSHLEIAKYTSGCYSMAQDNDPESQLEGLDVIFCVMPPDADSNWDSEDHGGSRHYMIAGDDEELVAIEP